MRRHGNPSASTCFATSALLSLLGACTLDGVDLAGRACPCGPGWTCVDSLCVEDGQDAGRDGGLDATDAGVDSGVDSGAADAADDTGRDASDAGPRDTGTDVGADVGVDAFDAGTDSGPPSVCETSTALFCDSFETGLSRWNRTETLGIVSLDDTRAVGGLTSARGTTTAMAGRAFLTKSFERLDSGTVYSRAWVYVPSSSRHHTMTFLLLSENAEPRYPLAALQISAGVSRVYVGSPHERWIAGSAPTFPMDRWVCTTLSAQPGTASPRVTATVDGTVVADETLALAVLARVDNLQVGIQYTNAASPSADIFVDEVELDTDPLPCE